MSYSQPKENLSESGPVRLARLEEKNLSIQKEISELKQSLLITNSWETRLWNITEKAITPILASIITFLLSTLLK